VATIAHGLEQKTGEKLGTEQAIGKNCWTNVSPQSPAPLPSLQTVTTSQYTTSPILLGKLG
jgi:hypothetical protein